MGRLVTKVLSITLSTVLASSGDSGYWSGGSSTPGLNLLALDPYTLAVGGVTIGLDSSGITSESGWSYSGVGYYTGNSIYDQPGYQTLYGTPGMPSTANSWRLIPDVAFPAAPSIVVLFDGKLVGGYGGTSFAAPMFAGVIANMDHLTNVWYGYSYNGWLNYNIYGMYPNSNDFNDITTGNNGMSAGSGWDYVTGLGTVNAYGFVYGLADSLNPGGY